MFKASTIEVLNSPPRALQYKIYQCCYVGLRFFLCIHIASQVVRQYEYMKEKTQPNVTSIDDFINWSPFNISYMWLIARSQVVSVQCHMIAYVKRVFFYSACGR